MAAAAHRLRGAAQAVGANEVGRIAAGQIAAIRKDAPDTAAVQFDGGFHEPIRGQRATGKRQARLGLFGFLHEILA